MSITQSVSFETAVEQISGALKAEGFGVLVALGIVGDNPDLHEVAKEADQRLRRALAALQTAVAK